MHSEFEARHDLSPLRREARPKVKDLPGRGAAVGRVGVPEARGMGGVEGFYAHATSFTGGAGNYASPEGYWTEIPGEDCG